MASDSTGPISRRLRFEILKRDNYTCRYCGASAPDATLHVDHVLPVSLGGTNEHTNLTTACAECNHGKGSSNPDAELVADVAETAEAYAAALALAAERRRAARRTTATIAEWFTETWSKWGYGPDGNRRLIPRDSDWANTIDQFHSLGLDKEDFEHFIDVAMRSSAPPTGTWRYFCGCCWNEIRSLQNDASRIASGGA